MQVDMPTVFQSNLGFENTFANKRILVTGHTGFTGGWLCLWLSMLGAKVYGISLEPNTNPSLFNALDIGSLTTSYLGNINHLHEVKNIFEDAQPEIVYHLAAQPLVKQAYDNPLESFMTNIMGTANVLEVARSNPNTKAVVCVTTDKVYKDKCWTQSYQEKDELGGKDPYSASKSAAEMVAYAYQATLSERGNNVAIGTARGGNIIGGGDWSSDRIVPDFVRAHSKKIPLTLRNPNAVRPWQHVISLCHGYLMLADGLLNHGEKFAEPFNFGPVKEDIKTVGELVNALNENWPGVELNFEEGNFHETHFLSVDSSKSNTQLGWQPPIRFVDTVHMTAHWYKVFSQSPSKIKKLCMAQINDYREKLL